MKFICYLLVLFTLGCNAQAAIVENVESIETAVETTFYLESQASIQIGGFLKTGPPAKKPEAQQEFHELSQSHKAGPTRLILYCQWRI